MPRPPSVDPLRATIQALGHQIGTELANAISRSFNQTVAAGPLKGRAAAAAGRTRNVVATGGKACTVPGCSRKAVSKGLCSNHYQKAHRLKLDTDKLSSGDLDTLAQDGRALRFKKAGASALVRRAKR